MKIIKVLIISFLLMGLVGCSNFAFFQGSSLQYPSVTGVQNGMIYVFENVQPAIEDEEMVEATLNGEEYNWGKIVDSGDYELKVFAQDSADDCIETLNFTVMNEAEDWDSFYNDWSVIIDGETNEKIYQSPSNQQGLSVIGSQSWQNYDVEIDIKSISSYLNFNFVFRFTDTDNYYRLLCSSGGIRLQKVEDGEVDAWVTGNIDYVFNDNQEYKTRLLVENDSIELYVDGEKEFEYDGLVLNEGKVGMRSWNTELLIESMRIR